MSPALLMLQAADAEPSGLSELTGKAEALLRWLFDHDLLGMMMALGAVAVLLTVMGYLYFNRGEKGVGRAPRIPIMVGSWFICAVLYSVGRAVDFFKAGSPPESSLLPAADAARAGYIEQLLLGRSELWCLLPLSDNPALAVLVHALLWGGLLALLFFGGLSVGGGKELRASTSRRRVPWHFRLAGCSTTMGLDSAVRIFLAPFTLVLLAALVIGSLTVPVASGSTVQQLARCANMKVSGTVTEPALASLCADPGLLVLLWLLGFVLFLLLKEPTARLEPEESKPTEEEVAKPVDPLKVLRESLSQVVPGADVAEELKVLEPEPADHADLPAGLPAIFGDTFADDWLDGGAPHRTLAQLLDVVHGSLRLSTVEAITERELTRQVDRVTEGGELPDCDTLVLCGPDSCGRSTALVAAGILAHLERGGCTLLLCRDADRQEELYQEVTRGLGDSAMRWLVTIARSGHGLRDWLASGRVPGLVICGLASFEEEVLMDRRMRSLLEAIDLVLVDRLNELTGPRELHAALCLQRLWLCMAHTDRPPELPLTFASAGPTFPDASSWATSALGRRAVAVPYRGPALKERVVIRRRHLLSPDDNELPVSQLALACEEAGLTWHLRMSGDGKRSIQRMEGELQAFTGQRVADPDRAAVVIVEGHFGEVERELAVTSRVGSDPRFLRGVQVAAAPREEEAALEPLGDGLPWIAVHLQPPADLRLNHAVRATHGRQLRRSLLKDRVLGGRLGSRLDRLVQEGVLEERELLTLPPSTFQPVRDRLLVRSSSAPPLPALDPGCVTNRVARLFDDATGSSLRRLDASTAPIDCYPGAVLLLPLGRYRVSGNPRSWRVEGEGYAASLLDAPSRSVVEREWLPDEASLWKLTTTDRGLGRRLVRCRSGLLTVRQRLLRVRRYNALRRQAMEEARDLSPSIETSLATRVLLLSCEGPDGRPPLSVLAPVVGVISLTSRSVLRSAEELLHVGLVEHGGRAYVGFIDKTPGGNGLSTAVDEGLIGTLLATARSFLDNLDEALLDRVRHHHDQVPGALNRAWDLEGARRWLADLVLPPESGKPLGGLPDQRVDSALLRSLEQVFPAVQWYPPQELSLFLEAVEGCLSAVPMRSRHGGKPTAEDRVCAAAGLCAVFYRRPDLALPEGLHIVFEPGRELRDRPGVVGYCQTGSDPHIAVALEALRASIPLDGVSLMPHEAGHLFDALDGTSDGLLPGMTSEDTSRWAEAAASEMPRAEAGVSLLSNYAATSIQEFCAEAIAAFVEHPVELQKRLPAVYRVLRSALRQDPASYLAGGDGGDAGA